MLGLFDRLRGKEIMPDKLRIIEIYRLTISGLPASMTYGQLFQAITKVLHREQRYIKVNSKHHSVEIMPASGEQSRRTVHRLRFTSYKEGSRPDVLNTETSKIQKNPLPTYLESVEYTHAILCRDKERYLLVLEHNGQGIWANTIAHFIEIVCNKYYSDIFIADTPSKEGIVVNLVPVPGESFRTKLLNLERITKATLRIVKPNPCWDDYEFLLGDMAKESNAGVIDITSIAPRRRGLSKKFGIVRYILDLFTHEHLDRAIVEGQTKDKTKEKYSTEADGIKEHVSVPTDAKGQVDSSAIYAKMDSLSSTK